MAQRIDAYAIEGNQDSVLNDTNSPSKHFASSL
jgi:hypothetical protein